MNDLSNISTPEERLALLAAICANPKLNGNAVKLERLLMDFINPKTGVCNPEQRTIMERGHFSTNTIDAAADALVRENWLRIYHGNRHRSNRYYLAFDRVREGGEYFGFNLMTGHPGVSNFKTEPHDGVSKSETPVPQNLRHGVSQSEAKRPAGVSNFEADSMEKKKKTKNTLSGEVRLPEDPDFDFEAWWERQFWPTYPKKKGELAAKEIAYQLIFRGRLVAGRIVKPKPAELLVGAMRYAEE